jgi:hypothetical protein
VTQSYRRLPARRPIVIAAMVASAAIGGWLAGSSAKSFEGLSVTGELTGRLSVVSESGAKVCIVPASGGPERCSGLYRGPSDRSLAVGDTVSVAIGQLRTGPAETTEIFILEP